MPSFTRKRTTTPDGITITGKSNTNNVTLKDTTVTISDLEIDASETGKAAISSNGKTIIELDGNNVLTGGKDHWKRKAMQQTMLLTPTIR